MEDCPFCRGVADSLFFNVLYEQLSQEICCSGGEADEDVG